MGGKIKKWPIFGLEGAENVRSCHLLDKTFISNDFEAFWKKSDKIRQNSALSKSDQTLGHPSANRSLAGTPPNDISDGGVNMGFSGFSGQGMEI